ncbi:MAG: hypothetical protein PHT07_21585 [Paludibacter sp.]|nr:hypothetical protein [Paludibacter sp.]
MNPDHMLTTDAEEFMIKSVIKTSSDNTDGTLMNEWGIFGVVKACLSSNRYIALKNYKDDDYLDELIGRFSTEEGFLVKKADFRYAIDKYFMNKIEPIDLLKRELSRWEQKMAFHREAYLDKKIKQAQFDKLEIEIKPQIYSYRKAIEIWNSIDLLWSILYKLRRDNSN